MDEYLDHEQINSSLEKAVACIREGGIVAFPTETYYGLAVDPDSHSAITNLFKIKRRQGDKPLLLLISRMDQLQLIAERIPHEYVPLMEKYWPGPLTLVFPAKHDICCQLTGNSGTIGVRISSHPIAGELVRKMGKPITATSANISGFKPAGTAAEVIKIFGNSLTHVVDGGQTPAGLCSTVLGLHRGKITLLRQGQIDLSAELRQ
jgi:L-threonylcarbamoyladenylate synthase